MDTRISELLDEKIVNQFDMISSLEAGSEERSKEISNLNVLYKLKLEETKIENDCYEKSERRDMDNRHHDDELGLKDKHHNDELELKNQHHKDEMEFKERQENDEAELRGCDQILRERQISEQVIDRWVNVGLQVGLALMGIGAYDAWYRRGLKFEENGTIASPMIKNLISRMLPKK